MQDQEICLAILSCQSNAPPLIGRSASRLDHSSHEYKARSIIAQLRRIPTLKGLFGKNCIRLSFRGGSWVECIIEMEHSNRFSIWRIPFRPFFLVTLLGALAPIIWWGAHLAGVYPLEASPFLDSQWHANEMIFGFVLSAVFGFLLTASPKWTNTQGVHGRTLQFLVGYFLTNRLLLWTLPFDQTLPYQIAGMLIPIWLAGFLIALFIRANSMRQMVIVFPILLFIPAQYFILGENYVLGYGLALGALRFLIVAIGGRIIPFFTRTALDVEVKGLNPKFEMALIFTMFVLAFEPLFKNSAPYGKGIWVFFLGIGLVLNVIRIYSWRFWEARKNPILLILYLAYAWLPVHFALSIFHYYSDWYDLGQGAVHALVYGSFGLMILGIIHRVTLGHTGRPIRATFITKMGYYLLFGGAVSRVFGPLFFPGAYITWIQVSSTAWLLSFSMVAYEIVPMLLSPRIDGKKD